MRAGGGLPRLVPRLVGMRRRLSASPFGKSRRATLWLTMATALVAGPVGVVEVAARDQRDAEHREVARRHVAQPGPSALLRRSRVDIPPRRTAGCWCCGRARARFRRSRHLPRPAARRSAGRLRGAPDPLVVSRNPGASRAGRSIARTCRRSYRRCSRSVSPSASRPACRRPRAARTCTRSAWSRKSAGGGWRPA